MQDEKVNHCKILGNGRRTQGKVILVRTHVHVCVCVCVRVCVE